MKHINLFLVRLFSLVALILFAGPLFATDWWPIDSLAMPIRPQGRVLQNPPVFSWPMASLERGYELILDNGLNKPKSFVVRHNWLQLDSPLPVGSYRWRVRALGLGQQAGTSWSTERVFTVDMSATVFIVPDAASLIASASEKTRPRSLPSGLEWDRLAKALSVERAADIGMLRERMGRLLGTALPVEPNQRFDLMASGAAKAVDMGTVRNDLTDEQVRIMSMGLLWRVDGDRRWAHEGIRRALSLAAWNPTGSTGLASHNQATRTILLTLAVAYDVFQTELTSPQRAAMLSAMRARYVELYQRIVASGYLAAHPFDPWGSYTLGYLVAVAPLLAGDIAEAADWFREAFPLYAGIFPSWSGDDGGYGNGTTYGVWDVPESIVLWDVLHWATGFDFYQKPAISNFGQMMAYFLPPGSPSGLFGDGAEVEMSASIARYGKAFAARAPTPLTDWYARQLFGEDKAAYVLVTAPVRSSIPITMPYGTPNSLMLWSVGWAAMHSDLADRSRISVYFKSSPFGSLNHSHADQNAFVIHAHGRNLAVDSGYYDYYNSPHWRDWYKQTRAHNAITFDGGKGQSVGTNGWGTNAAAGNVIRFESTNDYDLVVGDASRAYAGQVSKAIRTLIFFRPSTVVVVDQLAASVARQWEWNLHTTESLVPHGNAHNVTLGGAEMCLRVASPSTLDFVSISGYAPAPQMNIKLAQHFWNRFNYRVASNTGLFVSVLRMDCSSPEPQITFSLTGAKAQIGRRTISLLGDDVIVQ